MIVQEVWGDLVIWYLFLAGTGAGVYLLAVGHKVLRRQNGLERILNIVLRQEPYLEEIKVIDKDLRTLGEVSRREVVLPFSQRSNLNFINPEIGLYAVSGVFFSKDRRPQFFITVSIQDPHTRERMGYLQAKADFKGIVTQYVNTRIGDAGYVYFVDDNGNLIDHTDFSRVLRQENQRANPAVQSFLANKNAPYEYENSDGLEVIGLFARVGTPNWAVFIEQPVREAYQPIYTVTKSLLGIFMLTISGVTLLSIYFGLKLVRPIEGLEAQVKRMRVTGNLQADNS